MKKMKKEYRIAALAAGGVGLFFVLKKLFAKKEIPISTDDFTYTGYTLDEVTVTAGRKQTITTEQAYDYADDLEAAMDRLGTDFDTICDVARQMQTVEDWEAVRKAFGYRIYSKWLATTSLLDDTGGYSDIMAGTPISLKNWFIQELSDSEMTKLKSLLPNGCTI